MTGEGLEDTLDRIPVFRTAREGTVKIHHMQVLAALIGEDLRLRGGIVAIDGGAVHVALGQADDLTTLEVDGGEDDHCRTSPVKKRKSRGVTPLHPMSSPGARAMLKPPLRFKLPAAQRSWRFG
jgi:hypothetical protein